MLANLQTCKKPRKKSFKKSVLLFEKIKREPRLIAIYCDLLRFSVRLKDSKPLGWCNMLQS